MNTKAGTSLAAVALAVFTATAVGQEATDEIIVYGEKSAKTLQDTQASVGVVTAEAIVEKDIQSLRDAFRLFGNVIDADWVDAGFVIRGVNSEGLTPGGAPLAAIYLDGAQQTVQGARRGARGLWDVEQVEIYRGPQSTLSGRAALAGAIYIRSKDPTREWDFAARATGASLDTREGAIAFGGPLNDIFAFRIAADYQQSESDLSYPGYEQYSRFDDFQTDEYYLVRGKLAAEFERFDALLTISTAHDSPTYDDIAGPGLGFEYSEQRGDLNAGLPFFQEAREADNDTLSLEITSSLNDNLTFTSLTSYNQTDLDVPSINEGTPGEIFVTRGTQDQTLLTQEFRLNGGTGSPWVLGVYIADESQDVDQFRSVFFGGGRADTATVRSDFENVALFGEIEFSLSDSVTFTAGGRVDYSSFDTELDFVRDNFDPGNPDIAISGTNDDSQTTLLPKAAINWDIDETRSLGFTVQRGFRIGGAGIDGTDGSAFNFDEESTWTYETSYRSTLLNDRMTLNANVFYTDWEDQQVEVQLVPGDFTSSVTLNAGESNLYGGELESQFEISPELSGFFSIGYVRTEFDEFVTTVGDFSGFEFPEAPELTLAGGFDYKHESGFYAGVDAKQVTEYSARDLQNAPVDIVGDYVVVNARVGYRFGDWNVMLFSDNALDEEYFVYQDVIGTFDCCATLGERRVTGVTVTYGVN